MVSTDCILFFRTSVLFFFFPSLGGWWVICSWSVASRRRYAGRQAGEDLRGWGW